MTPLYLIHTYCFEPKRACIETGNHHFTGAPARIHFPQTKRDSLG